MAGVDHGHGHQVIFRHQLGHLFLVHLGRHAHDAFVAHREDRAPGVGDEKPTQGDHTDEMPMVVHHVELEGALVRDRLANVLDGLFHRGVLVHGDDVGRHESSGGVFRILEDLLDLFGFRLLHEVENLLRLLGGQLLHHVGGVLGRHLVEDARDLDLVEGAHQLEEGVVIEFGEDLAGALRREGPKDGDLLGQRELTEHGGEVGRVGFLEQRAVGRLGRPLAQVPCRFEQTLGVAHRRDASHRSIAA